MANTKTTLPINTANPEWWRKFILSELQERLNEADWLDAKGHLTEAMKPQEGAPWDDRCGDPEFRRQGIEAMLSLVRWIEGAAGSHRAFSRMAQTAITYDGLEAFLEDLFRCFLSYAFRPEWPVVHGRVPSAWLHHIAYVVEVHAGKIEASVCTRCGRPICSEH